MENDLKKIADKLIEAEINFQPSFNDDWVWKQIGKQEKLSKRLPTYVYLVAASMTGIIAIISFLLWINIGNMRNLELKLVESTILQHELHADNGILKNQSVPDKCDQETLTPPLKTPTEPLAFNAQLRDSISEDNPETAATFLTSNQLPAQMTDTLSQSVITHADTPAMITKPKAIIGFYQPAAEPGKRKSVKFRLFTRDHEESPGMDSETTKIILTRLN